MSLTNDQKHSSSDPGTNGPGMDEELMEDKEVRSGIFIDPGNEAGSIPQEIYEFDPNQYVLDVEEGSQTFIRTGKEMKSLTRSLTSSIRSSIRSIVREEEPKDTIESQYKKPTRKLILPVVLTCACLLLLISAGSAFFVFFVVLGDDGDSPAPKEDDIPIDAPTGAPITKEAGSPTNAPTDAPIIGPTSAAPTEPTEEPDATIMSRTVRLSGGPFTSSDNRLGENPMFGYALALMGDFLAVGEPNQQISSVGDVVIRKRGSGSWEQRDAGFATGTRRFGSSVDGAVIQNTASILVGASETRDHGALAGSGAGFGSAHFYQLEASSGEWIPVGNEMRPAMLIQESGGQFGSSVAMATDILRVAIGAPESSLDFDLLDAGRVYTYEYNGTDWQQMGNPIVGTGFGDRVGASLAMSKDGSRMLVGSPGDHSGAGAVWYFEWNPSLSRWKPIFALRGQDDSNEALGTTVAILSDDGRRIAFGGPGWGNNQGRIEVFEESTTYTGFFDKVGKEDIVGADGEQVGSTLCGTKGLLALGTESGSFRMYEFDTQNNHWVQVANGPDLGSPVVSMAIAKDASSIAVGHDNQKVHVYDLV